MTAPDDLIPAGHRELLERPLYGHLGTVRPDGGVQVNPMWFEFDGEHVLFSHTTKRQKFRNLSHSPAMSMSVIDPDNPFRYLEVAGRLVEARPDTEGEFYMRLQKRYGNATPEVPQDAPDRVVLVMSIERATKQ